MAKNSPKETVLIRPGVNILSVLSRLNYKPWFAIAEFIDNSLQSFLDHRSALRTSGSPKLKIKITYDAADGGKLSIRDNAAGISIRDFKRAFRAASVPPDTSGLHEYGMGMKSAACWFSSRWEVRTSHLGDPFERIVKFDIKKIVKDELEELDVQIVPASKSLHYTEIVLRDLHRSLFGKTHSKIRAHLASIYREYIRSGLVEVDFEGKISYADPEVLKASPAGSGKKAITWRKPISIDLGGKKRIEGFAALREVGSTSEAGFALFRKKRLIHGSLDEAWRPEAIFGKPNSYTSQRLFGELHFFGFEVSHTKDAFVWDQYEERVIEKLLNVLEREPLDLLKQAEGHRAKTTAEAVAPAAQRALQTLGKVLVAPPKLAGIIQKQVDSASDYKASPRPKNGKGKINDEGATKHLFSLEFDNDNWEVSLMLDFEHSARDFVDITDVKGVRDNPRKIGIKVSGSHPFFQSYVGDDKKALELLFAFVVAFVVAETAARDGGVSKAGLIRENMNELLRKIFKGGT